jgi:hypothetical protein
MKNIPVLISLIVILSASCGKSEESTTSDNTASTNISGVIDVHNHLVFILSDNSRDVEGAANTALAKMDSLGVQTLIVMPPPFTPNQSGSYSYTEYTALSGFSNRIKFIGGGGTLNPLIQQAISAGSVTSAIRNQFTSQVQEIIDAGAIGFGEMAILHISRNPSHEYISAPANHELFKLLSDLAANVSLPIDIHMEAVPASMDTPKALLDASPANPTTLPANISDFEELLAHNRNTKIVWAHLGWDNSGNWTSTLTDELLGRNSNLYISFRVSDDTSENLLLEGNGNIKTEWHDLFKKYSDRFVVGSDQFFKSGDIGNTLPENLMDMTSSSLSQLDESIRNKLLFENANAIYNLQ